MLFMYNLLSLSVLPLSLSLRIIYRAGDAAPAACLSPRQLFA